MPALLTETVPEWVLSQESLAMYKPGGYRPTCTRERLHLGRYQVVGILGFGQESMVCLAIDSENRLTLCVSKIDQWLRTLCAFLSMEACVAIYIITGGTNLLFAPCTLF